MDRPKRTKSEYPCGPCELPLECSECGTVITAENQVVHDECHPDRCDGYFCYHECCPQCDTPWHCGGCE